MFNRSKYAPILKIVLSIVIIAILGIIGVMGYKMYNQYYIVSGAKAAVTQFEEALKNNTTSSEITTKYKKYTVIGIIKIPTIDIKYPILSENTTEALETSVVLRYTSQGLNNIGNSVIIGHNYRNNIMFSNLDKLIKGNSIYITDNTGREIEYKIYNIYTDAEGESNYLTRNTDGKREISLSTSTDDGKAKIIVLAREK